MVQLQYLITAHIRKTKQNAQLHVKRVQKITTTHTMDAEKNTHTNEIRLQ